MGSKGIMQQRLQGGLKIVGFFQNVGELPQFFRHHGIHDGTGTGDGLAGANHTELELVAGKSQRGGTVAVGGVLRDLRQGVHADLQVAL